MLTTNQRRKLLLLELDDLKKQLDYISKINEDNNTTDEQRDQIDSMLQIISMNFHEINSELIELE